MSAPVGGAYEARLTKGTEGQLRQMALHLSKMQGGASIGGFPGFEPPEDDDEYKRKIKDRAYTPEEANHWVKEINIRGCNVQAMVACLAGQSDVVVVYLFGSVAQGRARPGSDVDVAVLVDAVADEDPLTLFERRLDLTSAVEPFVEGKLDLVLLNQASNLLQSQVLRDRCVLYERSWSERVAFEVAVMKVYHDLKVMRIRQWETLLCRMEEGHLGRRRRDTSRTLELAYQLSGRLVPGREHNV